jgi:hypothetical protein
MGHPAFVSGRERQVCEKSRLKRLCPTVIFVVQGATNDLVETACRKVGLEASVERLRTIFVEP